VILSIQISGNFGLRLYALRAVLHRSQTKMWRNLAKPSIKTSNISFQESMGG